MTPQLGVEMVFGCANGKLSGGAAAETKDFGKP
jgi:hypothetical protein